jgi:2-hydroxy-3-oxopropionate reductase
MTTRVGFVGLGIMGRPMAKNLINAGYSLAVYARRPDMMKPLVTAGATGCETPQAVAAQSDITFTMVSDTPDVEQVILGEQGVIHGAQANSIVVDMSTISPSATRHMAEMLIQRDIHMLDAPVSGGEQGAIDGTLSIMVGGKEDTFQKVLPLFEVLGKNIVHIGDHGAGQVTKACNQIVIAQTLVAVSEAFILARVSGADPAKVRAALLGGFAGSRVLETHGQRILEHNFKPGFKARLHQKDLRICMEAAHELGIALPGASLATQTVNALIGEGLGEEDSSALATILERMSGVTI